MARLTPERKAAQRKKNSQSVIDHTAVDRTAVGDTYADSARAVDAVQIQPASADSVQRAQALASLDVSDNESVVSDVTESEVLLSDSEPVAADTTGILASDTDSDSGSATSMFSAGTINCYSDSDSDSDDRESMMSAGTIYTPTATRTSSPVPSARFSLSPLPGRMGGDTPSRITAEETLSTGFAPSKTIEIAKLLLKEPDMGRLVSAGLVNPQDLDTPAKVARARAMLTSIAQARDGVAGRSVRRQRSMPVPRSTESRVVVQPGLRWYAPPSRSYTNG